MNAVNKKNNRCTLLSPFILRKRADRKSAKIGFAWKPNPFSCIRPGVPGRMPIACGRVFGRIGPEKKVGFS